MHPNPIYRKTGRDRNIAFARDMSFGVLSINGADGPLLSHIPFVLNEDNTALEAHLLASNPIWRALETPQKAVIAVNGPNGYISPDWYGIEDQVPTWNYVAVHLRGQLERVEQDVLQDHLDRLSEQFEARLLPKPIWRSDKMSADMLTKFRRMIRPVSLQISSIEGTWKLNQNKPDEARLSAATSIETSQYGMETEALAALMRTPPAAE